MSESTNHSNSEDPKRSSERSGARVDSANGDGLRAAHEPDDGGQPLHDAAAALVDRWVADYLESEAFAIDSQKLAATIVAQALSPSSEVKSSSQEPASFASEMSNANRREVDFEIQRSPLRPAESRGVNANVNPSRRQNSWKRWGAGMALLASALSIAILLSPQGVLIDSPANADAILSAAHAVHDQPIERIYEVTIEREIAGEDSELPRSIIQNVRVATQGDRFWVEMNRGPRQWVWGREADGTIWIVLGPHAAIELKPEEVGEPLRRMADIYSLSLTELLDDLPKGFELREVKTQSPTLYRLEATARRARPTLSVKQVSADFDRDTHEVQSLMVKRRLSDQHLTTTTYRLVESRPADSSLYQAQGHLEGFNRVIDSRVPLERRREMLIRRLGPVAGRWIVVGAR